MKVNALDHYNIITDRLDETARFYAAVLGLERRDGPPPFTPQQIQWMFDDQGRALIHINSLDCPRFFDREVEPGAVTGAIHHVAFTCENHAGLLERLGALGIAFETNHLAAIGLRQVFIVDPNNIVLELNFFGD
ncbi:MAG: VOC family protein [Sphingomonadales bacterium]|nr:VOC family protein [Sphingomonadales bacterium]